MPARRLVIVIDAEDPDALREFWAVAMRYEPYSSSGPYRSAVPPAGETGPKLMFQRVDDPRSQTKNRLHIDVNVGDEIERETRRPTELGATRISTGLVEEAGSTWVLLADPAGNEFCLVSDT